MKKRLLVIDDETSVCNFLKITLESAGYETQVAHTGRTGLEMVVSFSPELIILDYGLPDISGIDVLTKIRSECSIPVIFLTVRDGDDDKVCALDCGADDYLTKPFSTPELLARIRVALRHSSGAVELQIIRVGVLEVDQSLHVIRVAGSELKLTPTEFSLLLLLAKHAGRVMSHRQILKEIWGPNSVEHYHYLRVYFGQIRKKIERASPGAGDLLQNESGVGYRLRETESL